VICNFIDFHQATASQWPRNCLGSSDVHAVCHGVAARRVAPGIAACIGPALELDEAIASAIGVPGREIVRRDWGWA